MSQPANGQWYQATDGNWYCWPNPTPYASQPESGAPVVAQPISKSPQALPLADVSTEQLAVSAAYPSLPFVEPVASTTAYPTSLQTSGQSNNLPGVISSGKPFWKKKRYFVPAGLFAGLILIGALNPSEEVRLAAANPAASPSPTPTLSAQQVAAAAKAAATQAAADKAAADKAAAVQTAADKEASDQAAAAQAAADKTAADAAAADAAEAALTSGQRNARDAAKKYLSFAAFSRTGLIRQLESDAGDGYTHAEAVFGVDAQNADWNEQAFKAAQKYLSFSSFSRQGLIEQLESDAGDGYTHAQAVYGTDRAMS